MKDLLGRDIKTGDLVVVKGTGRYNLGLRLGVVSETGSVNFLNGGSTGYSQYFLIGNPSKEELEHKQKILDEIEETRRYKEEKKLERKSLKSIPYKDLIPGKAYKNDRGYIFIFLGKGKVINSSNYRRYSCEEEEGYIYIPNSRYIELGITYDAIQSIIVRKSKMRLVEEVTLEVNPFEDFVKQEEVTKFTKTYSYSGETRGIVIELEK